MLDASGLRHKGRLPSQMRWASGVTSAASHTLAAEQLNNSLSP